jgi:pimeloyl-ACP methyl ester carboxylesterase
MADPVSRRIQLPTGLSYHVLEWGGAEDLKSSARDAPTVILLHGFLDFAWTWEKVVCNGLQGRYRLIAPDLRGHGDSDRVGAGGYYHFMDYVADIHGLVEQVVGATQAERPRIALVGHSMGGSVAAYYTAAFPEQVSHLALLEGLGPPEEPLASMPERIRTWVAAWKRARAQPPRPISDRAAAASRLRQHDPLLGEELALQLAEHGTVSLPDGRCTFKHDPLHLTPGPYPFTLDIAGGFYSRITCPVLLVTAEQSEFHYSPEELQRRKACFKNARLQAATLSGAGHMMQRHKPAALARLLSEFLSQKA